jgi:hypothetical protein
MATVHARLVRSSCARDRSFALYFPKQQRCMGAVAHLWGRARWQVANEAPADIKSNMVRAWANFSQQRVDSCTKPSE